MNTEQLERMHSGKGFIAALDQSGGSTPKALLHYGIEQCAYSNDEEMFDLVHQMRTRVITSPAFTSEHILGAILFKDTMNRTIEGQPTAEYLWEQKGIVPILKVDEGLDALEDGVQLMKPMPHLDGLLKQAVEKKIFGTKMRSVIKEFNPAGIKKIVDQQFSVGKQILEAGLIPILEPEVDIHSATKAQCEQLLLDEIQNRLAVLGKDEMVIFKLTIPTITDFYRDLMADLHVVRVVALSGGYTQSEADEKLALNHGLIASFSRALLQGLNAAQSGEEFNRTLANSIKAIFEASMT